MKNSTTDKLRQLPPGYLIMGIDPHKKIHVAVAMTQDTIIHTKFKFANSRQGYEDVIKKEKDQMVKTGGRGVIFFAVETGGHYWRNLAYLLDEQVVPLLFLLPRIWGITGVWLSLPISDILGFVVAVLWLLREYKIQQRTSMWSGIPVPNLYPGD